MDINFSNNLMRTLFQAQTSMVQAQFQSLAGNPMGALQNLQNAFSSISSFQNQAQAGMMSGQIPPFGAFPSPAMMMPQMGPLCGGGYSQFQRTDFAPGSGNGFFDRIFDPNRRSAANFERQLNTNPFARAAFESSVGGRYCPDSRNDGVITVQRFAPGFAPIPGFAQNPLANTALGMFQGMEQSILGQAGRLGLLGAGLGGLAGLATGNPFGGLMLGGLGGLAGGLLSGALGQGLGLQPGLGMGGFGGGMGGFGGGIGGFGGLPPMGGSPFGFGFGGLQSPLGGTGFGSWNPNAAPGRMQNTNPAYERAHQAEVDSVLRDPSLTVEDKVTLMLMLIMKKMDKDIERQAEYINSLQQQQGNRGKKGGGGSKLGPIGKIAGGAIGGPAGAGIGGKLGGAMGGGQGENSSSSIDVESQKLARMVQKRNQMFEILKSIIDKYNETAKSIIQSLGR